MKPVLIVYASTHGHTAKVAAAIAQAVEAEGHPTDLRDVRGIDPLHLEDFAAVIVGASIHAGRHQRELVDWARHHAVMLGAVPSAFFTVCLAAADDSDESRQAVHDFLEDIVDETGWTPDRRAAFAGALQYREYDAATRIVMRLLMARGGRDTDVSRDHDYTDWDAVRAFARECVEGL